MIRIKALFIVTLICLIHILVFKHIDYSFIFIIFLISVIYIKLYSKDKIKEAYRQLEIYTTLINSLNIKKPILASNALDDYAANPDFLFLINDIINKYKPSVIVEAGSGVSTLICAYSLQKLSNGKIFSLDHDKDYQSIVKSSISEHYLDNFVESIHAPLVDYQNHNFKWYDIKELNRLNKIDLLIIDGPPVKFSKNIRYPAIPLLLNKIKKGAIIILDDCKRKEEKNVVSLWKKEFDCFDYKYIDNCKGAYIIKKIK
tara:strand:- start:467 stop:1240 length:774 start_codon:yes stop_codon:yes gene_type:complete